MKNYLILGASSELGRALIASINEKANGLGDDEKICIYAHYNKSEDELKAIADRLSDLVTLIPVQADLSQPGSVQSLIDFLNSEKVSLTHIVSFAAAPFKYSRIAAWDADRVKCDMQIQVFALAEILKNFLPQMAENNYGRVAVMLSSVVQGCPPKFLSEYVTVKYALSGMIRSLAADFADQGISINAVSPAMIETRFIKGIGRKAKEMSAELSPRGRNLQAEDVIPTIEFLLSDECYFMNGENINLSAMPY